MPDFEVAIPSHQRPDTLMTRTWPLLTGRGVDPEQITVFLPDHAQISTYVAAGIPEDRIVAGHGTGVRAARNAIADRYPTGTRLVSVDDDLQDCQARADEKTLTPVTDLPTLWEETADIAGKGLWGVYPVGNPYFMRNRTRTGLTFIIGQMFGYTVTHNPQREHVTLDCKEDYERSCRFYLTDGTVTRRDDICLKTRYAQEPGGMQTYRTEALEKAGAHRLARMYPDLAHPYKRRDGRTEIRLRDKGGH